MKLRKIWKVIFTTLLVISSITMYFTQKYFTNEQVLFTMWLFMLGINPALLILIWD